MPSDYEQIRKEHLRRYGTDVGEFMGLLAEDLYADGTHFIYEILQNAEDAEATHVAFRLYEDRLEIEHDGKRCFTEEDVKGVCAIAKGTKREDETKIGKFGIGFKSVHAYTSTPEIHSGGEHFRIEDYVLPYGTEPSSRLSKEGHTLFILPFNANAKDFSQNIACSEIRRGLEELESRTLLFLSRVIRISYEFYDGTSGEHQRSEERTRDARKIVISDGSTGARESWLVFERKVVVPGAREGEEKAVEVAFLLRHDAERGREEIERAEDTRVVVYFPTEQETRLGFLIQGPFNTNTARESLKRDEWNPQLCEHIAALLRSSLPKLRDMGLLTVSALEALPVDEEDFPEDSMFRPIFDAVVAALQEEDLLPTSDGGFTSAENAFLPDAAALRELLSGEQLQSFFDLASPPFWLDGAITERGRYANLWSYAKNVLKVEEVGSISFISRLASAGEFLRAQSDEWMVRLYGYLPSLRYLRDALRRLPIIRLRDGSHAAPFKSNGAPRVYLPVGEVESDLPTVKSSLVADETALKFLQELGIPPLDFVAEVMDKVLPKYETESSVSPEENERDLEKIARAASTEDIQRRQQLLSQLCATSFLRAESLKVDGTSYAKPEDVYFESEDLLAYFSGYSSDPSFRYLSSSYGEKYKALLKELGVAERIRVQKRDPNYRGYIVLKSEYASHCRTLDGYDPTIQVDGLENALSSPTVEKSRYIWENIALPNLNCIRGQVEFSTRQDYSDSTFEEDESERFGKLLARTKWLPNQEGVMHKPSELSMDDLPPEFPRNSRLAEQLRMKGGEEVVNLAVKYGHLPENLQLILGRPDLAAKLADKIREAEEGYREEDDAGENLDLEEEKARVHHEEDEDVKIYPSPKSVAEPPLNRPNTPPEPRTRLESSGAGTSSHLHITRNGERVMSKNEVIVADVLYSLGIPYEYERSLRSRDGKQTKEPDFTIVMPDGRYFFWEHVSSRSSKNKRIRWYKENQRLSKLLISENGPHGSINSQKIERMARREILGEEVGEDDPDEGG